MYNNNSINNINYDISGGQLQDNMNQTVWHNSLIVKIVNVSFTIEKKLDQQKAENKG